MLLLSLAFICLIMVATSFYMHVQYCGNKPERPETPETVKKKELDWTSKSGIQHQH